MRLSTSPFPFDPTTATAEAGSGAAPATAAAAGATAGSFSFGQLLEAETAPSPAQGPGAASPISAGASAPAAAVATATARRGLFEPMASPVASAAAAEALMGAGMPSAAEASEETIPSAPAASRTTTANEALGATTVEAQAELAALAAWLGSLAGPAGEPALEDVQVTVDGQTFALGTTMTDSTRAGGGTTATTLSSRSVRTAYQAGGEAGALGADETTRLASPDAASPTVSQAAGTTPLTASTGGGAALPPDAAARLQEGARRAGRESAAAPASGKTAGMQTSRELLSTAVSAGAAAAGLPVPMDAASAARPSATALGLPLDPAADRAAAEPPPPNLDEPSADLAALTPDSGVGPGAGMAAGTTTGGLSASSARTSAGRSGSTKAKIAGGVNPSSAETRAREAAEQKLSLAAEDVELASGERGLGTNTAKTKAPMPAPAPTPASTTRLNEPASSSAAAPLTFDAMVKEGAALADPEITGAAQRAVDSALAMADRFSTGAQRGVSLQFSVSGVDLAVRVEMRADGVHTFFRTDSPELRTALAQEWQTVVTAQNSESGQRLVDPVFTSPPAGHSTSSDAGTANHRQPSDPQRQQHAAEAGAQRSMVSSSGRRAATVASVAAVPPRPITLSTVRHLHTFA